MPDFRLNPALEQLRALSPQEKAKVEFLCNECCRFGCPDRRAAMRPSAARTSASPARSTAALPRTPRRATGFPEQWKIPASSASATSAIRVCRWVFPEFKLEGRGLGSAMVLEFLLYYMTKPEYQIRVREAIYLDAMLDLF